MRRYEVAVNGVTHDVTLVEKSGSSVTFTVSGETHTVDIRPVLTTPASSGNSVAISAPPPAKSQKAASSGDVVAPMPGIIVHVQVVVGAVVAAGQTVVVVEAMKMENNIPAPVAGTVKKIHVSPGAEVEGGQVLVTIG